MQSETPAPRRLSDASVSCNHISTNTTYRLTNDNTAAGNVIGGDCNALKNYDTASDKTSTNHQSATHEPKRNFNDEQQHSINKATTEMATKSDKSYSILETVRRRISTADSPEKLDINSNKTLVDNQAESLQSGNSNTIIHRNDDSYVHSKLNTYDTHTKSLPKSANNHASSRQLPQDNNDGLRGDHNFPTADSQVENYSDLKTPDVNSQLLQVPEGAKLNSAARSGSSTVEATVAAQSSAQQTTQAVNSEVAAMEMGVQQQQLQESKQSYDTSTEAAATAPPLQFLPAMEGAAGEVRYCLNSPSGTGVWHHSSSGDSGGDMDRDTDRKRAVYQWTYTADNTPTRSSPDSVSEQGSMTSLTHPHDYSLDSLEFNDNGSLSDYDMTGKQTSIIALHTKAGGDKKSINSTAAAMKKVPSIVVVDLENSAAISMQKDTQKCAVTDSSQNNLCTCGQSTNCDLDKFNTCNDAADRAHLSNGVQIDNNNKREPRNSLLSQIDNVRAVRNVSNGDISNAISSCPLHSRANGYFSQIWNDDASDTVSISSRDTADDVSSRCECECDATTGALQPKASCREHAYSYSTLKPSTDSLPKSASTPSLRKNKVRIPRLRAYDVNKTRLLECDSDSEGSDTAAFLQGAPLHRCAPSENVHLMQAAPPHAFSPSLKRKLSSHKQETDLDQLKKMADKLSLSTRRPSYLMWKERLNSDALRRLTTCHENAIKNANATAAAVVTNGHDDDVNNDDKEEAEDKEEAQNDERSRTEGVEYALAWLRRELVRQLPYFLHLNTTVYTARIGYLRE